METVGILESSSIAKGIEAADAVIKAAEVELLYAKPVCPGKYSIVFYGEVAAVEASRDAGCMRLENYLVDSVVIPRVHPQVIRTISLSSEPEFRESVGVMEFYSVTAAVYAADAAVKAAEVHLLDIRLGIGIGGKSFVILTGEVAAVTEAVRCGTAEGQKRGLVVATVVIPGPSEEIFRQLL